MDMETPAPFVVRLTIPQFLVHNLDYFVLRLSNYLELSEKKMMTGITKLCTHTFLSLNSLGPSPEAWVQSL
jgi:hypothetical protein